MLALCADTVDTDHAIRRRMELIREYTNRKLAAQVIHTFATHLALDSVHRCVSILT